ncbi:speedy protein A [Antennarius striatus]|uniref:speedy protein A n=1 Tax=Antennarius striatus TaxID=241820 RepID=UPI0035B345EF
MMKRSHKWHKTLPSDTVKVKRNNGLRSPQVRRGPRLNGTDGPQAPPKMVGPGGHRYNRNAVIWPTIVIQRQEIISFFRLFDDDLIQDFLWMDSCCKMSDKYLLAMTFVYFKRAQFTTAEYTRKNFFIALYLANTMEEDEEENKYEIFPWALGKNWRKEFPSFLKQRDKLWARIQFRAAVSRRCCEEVMAIVPSHFLWKRKRSERHSGARRQCSVPDQACFPRGPMASPMSCAICNHDNSRINEDASSWSRRTFTQSQSAASPYTLTLSLEVTPPRAAASRRETVETTIQTRSTSCHGSEKVSSDGACSDYDASMDWICVEQSNRSWSK